MDLRSENGSVMTAQRHLILSDQERQRLGNGPIERCQMTENEYQIISDLKTRLQDLEDDHSDQCFVNWSTSEDHYKSRHIRFITRTWNSDWMPIVQGASWLDEHGC